MAKDIRRMSRKEIDRLMILRGVINGEVKQVMAAEVLGLSERQVRRMVKRIREEGSCVAGEEGSLRSDGPDGWLASPLVGRTGTEDGAYGLY